MHRKPENYNHPCATIGSDFLTCELEHDNNLVTLQILDTAGQERFQSLGHAFYRGADICIFIYDITDKNTFNNIEKWRKEFVENCQTSETCISLLLGNKMDTLQPGLNSKSNRQVDVKTAKEYANKHDIQCFEISALQGTNVINAVKSVLGLAINQSRNSPPSYAVKSYMYSYTHKQL